MASVDHDGGRLLRRGGSGSDGRTWPPEIFNTDQGVQFTSAAFLDQLATVGVQISMDGKGRFLDNIFIERLWRSLKYEEVVCCERFVSAETKRNFTGDGGRPPEVGLQGQASNRHKLRG